MDCDEEDVDGFCVVYGCVGKYFLEVDGYIFWYWYFGCIGCDVYFYKGWYKGKIEYVG